MLRATPRAGTLAVLWLLAALPLSVLHAEEPKADDVAFFESKVRPILVERCYECHSAGSKTVRGGLLLDSKAGWEKGGDSGPVIEPGKPEDSLLIQGLSYEDAVLKMPPKGKLPEAEVAVLADWVRRGAPDPRNQTAAAAGPKPKRTINLSEERKHWAFQPLATVEPPAVAAGAVANPIDRFLLAKLEPAGIGFTAEPSRRVLARRLFFDLIGLPPTPEELAAIEADAGADWYDRLMKGLLDRPQFGERWARHWLDLARFAESHGFEHDYDRPTAYHYRDFLIEALNRDLPFDQFVKWQLAGDEYAPNDPLALKATGFLAAGTHSTQITANQVEKERYDELDDMIATTGTAFLGLTIGCARCHDHKFDPIPANDYYRLISTFTTTVRSEVELPGDPEAHAKALAKYEAEHQPYLAALAKDEAEQLPGRLAAWEQQRGQDTTTPRWVVLDPSAMKSSGGASFAKLPDGSLRVEGKNADFDTYTITAAIDLAEITAIKVEALADPSLVAGGPGRAGNGNFALTNLTLKVGPRYGIGATTQPSLINPKASFEQAGLPVAAVVDADPKSAWAVDPQFGKDHAAVFELGSDTRTDSGATLTFTLEFNNNTGHNIGRLRLSATDARRPVGLDGDGVPPAAREVLARPAAERTPEQTAALLAWYRTIDPQWRALKKAIDDHAATMPKPAGVKALVSTEGLPAVRLHTQGGDFLEKTHVLRRGDPNQKESEAKPGFLQVFTDSAEEEARWQAPPPEGWRTSYRRRNLAEWMTDVDHGAGQLLARVAVNRIWQHHFGKGIVSTPSDFGTQGSPPSHPELLDWLARELIRQGWRTRPIHELILTSQAYRQGSKLDPAHASADPENRLYGRQERRRLEAEPIRDAMLSVSGLLDPRMYGPGSLEESMRRRSIYFTIKRSHLIPMLTLFDAPDALVPIAVRAATTVAPQSLLLLNSPHVREWAAGFADRVRPADATETARTLAIDRAYVLALGRAPTDRERADARMFLDRQTVSHREAGHADGIAPAWTDFCQVLYSLNEFVFIE